MSVEENGYYDNFCLYCNGSGVVADFEGEVLCSACGGRGQWDDDEPWGFMPLNSKNDFVVCVLCGAHGMGLPTHDRDGNRIRHLTFGTTPWQRTCLGPHGYFCACGKVFPKLQSLGAHVASNRRWRNPGHGSMERVGY